MAHDPNTFSSISRMLQEFSWEWEAWDRYWEPPNWPEVQLDVWKEVLLRRFPTRWFRSWKHQPFRCIFDWRSLREPSIGMYLSCLSCNYRVPWSSRSQRASLFRFRRGEGSNFWDLYAGQEDCRSGDNALPLQFTMPFFFSITSWAAAKGFEYWTKVTPSSNTQVQLRNWVIWCMLPKTWPRLDVSVLPWLHTR